MVCKTISGWHKLVFLLLMAVATCGQADPPQRVISLAPHITEILFRIGADSYLVGRSDYCVYPEGALLLPTVGGYLNPDFERMVALEPALALIFPNTQLSEKLTHLSIPARPVSNETTGEILQGIEELGALFKREAQAATVVAGIRDTLALIRRQSAHWPARRALILIGREKGSLRGLYAAGQETYLTEILNYCRITNVFADIDVRYFEVAKEDLVLRDPDMIIEFRFSAAPDAGHERDLLKQDWQPLKVLSAVKNDRVYIFTDRSYLIPGPRLAQGAMRLFQTLGPESK